MVSHSHVAPSNAAEIDPAAHTLTASSTPLTAFMPACTPYQVPVAAISTLVSFTMLRVKSCIASVTLLDGQNTPAAEYNEDNEVVVDKGIHE